MFTWLFDSFAFLLSFLGVIGGVFSGFVSWLREHVFVSILAGVLTLLGAWVYIMTRVNSGLAQVMSIVQAAPDQSAATSALSDVMQFLARVNSVFPVDNFLTAVLTVVMFRVFFASYRFIKSWIPTVSGS